MVYFYSFEVIRQRKGDFNLKPGERTRFSTNNLLFASFSYLVFLLFIVTISAVCDECAVV